MQEKIIYLCRNGLKKTITALLINKGIIFIKEVSIEKELYVSDYISIKKLELEMIDYFNEHFNQDFEFEMVSIKWFKEQLTKIYER